MKEELNSLLKEQEDEKDPEEEENDVTDTPVDDTTSDKGEDEAPSDTEEIPDEESDELPSEDEPELPAMDDELGSEESEEGSEDEDFLDMTGASEEEVLKVFKAMKPEDGIVVKKDGNTVQFSDDGNDYIIKLDDEESEEGGEDIAEQAEPAENEEIVYEIELNDEDECDECKKSEATEGVNSPFDNKAKKVEAKESVTVSKSVTTKDGQPFDKKSPQQGVKKLQANEEKMVEPRPGTAPKGTDNPETKEPGRGQVKTSDGRPGTGPKGTDSAKKFDDLGKGKNKTSSGDWKGTEPKGTGKPVMKEPKEGEVKEVEATEAARTKWNPHGNKPEDGPKRSGIPSKKIFKAGSTVEALNEQVETLKKQNDEYKKALVLFKDKLNEVAVFNANLAYATRLFTEHSTTKQEKLDILKRFDSISTITESKNLYGTIKGELETKKPISESAAEKIKSTKTSSSTQEMLSESKAYENPQFARMKDLMKKIN